MIFFFSRRYLLKIFCFASSGGSNFIMRLFRKKFLCALCRSPEILMIFFLAKTPFLKHPSVRHQRSDCLFFTQNSLFEGPLCPPPENLCQHFFLRPCKGLLPLPLFPPRLRGLRDCRSATVRFSIICQK